MRSWEFSHRPTSIAISNPVYESGRDFLFVHFGIDHLPITLVVWNSLISISPKTIEETVKYIIPVFTGLNILSYCSRDEFSRIH